MCRYKTVDNYYSIFFPDSSTLLETSYIILAIERVPATAPETSNAIIASFEKTKSGEDISNDTIRKKVEINVMIILSMCCLNVVILFYDRYSLYLFYT